MIVREMIEHRKVQNCEGNEMVKLLSTPGGKIRLARMQAGLSSTDLVDLVNQQLQRMIREGHPVLASDEQGKREPSLSTGHLSNIERGKRLPSTAVEVAIATVLQISLDELYDLPTAKVEAGFTSPLVREMVEYLEKLDDDTQELCLILIQRIYRLDQERRNLQEENAALMTRLLSGGTPDSKDN